MTAPAPSAGTYEARKAPDGLFYIYRNGARHSSSGIEPIDYFEEVAIYVLVALLNEDRRFRLPQHMLTLASEVGIPAERLRNDLLKTAYHLMRRFTFGDAAAPR
ncbi:hypothetical protein [Nonomuraea sediminis]|uniref:hypothetical protein n=1 Tax=Nonomuraea sediminis TaxID=2835864 RepID=UPI001BDC42AF|nr:hypothetical protein [Nonomuraea sediminis]